MKIKLVFKIICFSIIFLLSTKIQAQKTQKSYLDVIDYWKKENFNKKVKEKRIKFKDTIPINCAY